MRELSIYIHIPFCVQKCRYCDFLSYPAAEEERDAYLQLLLLEIKKQSLFYKTHRVISVFIGGGTPSVLDAKAVIKIIDELKHDLTFAEGPEITIEVNPGTVTKDKLAAYMRAGINRLSIGLQTADEKELRMLGRIHDYRQFCNTYQQAREVGFQNINIDLMSAIPGQTAASYQSTLKTVLELEPEHISAYSLILEEGTWFYEHRKELALLTEEEDRQLYELTEKLLAQYNYYRYEISNYAKKGYECVHNKVYWQRGDYVGFGLGAASMVEEVRFHNKRTLEEYRRMLQGASEQVEKHTDSLPGNSGGGRTGSLASLRTRFSEEIQFLTKEEQMEEFMFLGLRLMKGVEKRAFAEKFGIPVEAVYGETLQKLEREGLLFIDASIRLTAYGIDISNYVMSQFLLEH